MSSLILALRQRPSTVSGKPIDDLLVRASWGETFRAPSVVDLFGGGRESFPAAADPCRIGNWSRLSSDAQTRCRAAGVPAGGADDTRTQLRSLLGGNPFSLKSENGENLSAGLVYSPSYFEGFDIARLLEDRADRCD